MALPNKDNYIPVKTIYILQCPIKYDNSGNPLEGWFIHGVQFNAQGKGSTTSYNDRSFLIDNAGCKDISKRHWAAKAKEWEKLVKAFSYGKGEAEPEVEDKPEVVEEIKAEPKTVPKRKYASKTKKG